MNQTSVEQDVPEPVISVSDAGPARKKLSIEIPAERIAAKLSENFESLRQEATIPGFRRGRVPLRLLEKRFGGDVRKEVCNQLVGESYSDAVEKHELRVLGEPDIKGLDEMELPEEGPLHVEIEIEVAPEVELPDLKDLEIARPAFEVTEAQVDEEIGRFRRMYGRMADARDEVRAEDYLTAGVEIRSEAGEVLEERPETNIYVPGREPNDYKGVVAGILVEDLGRKLAGHKPGDGAEVEAEGPDQHENEKLRGRKLAISIRIHRIQRVEPLGVEELVETAGFDSERELREQVRRTLEQRAEAEQRSAMAEQVAEALLEKVEMELPQQLSARQAQQVLRRRALEMMYRGATEQDIERRLAELRASSEEQARRQLKLLFILDAAARELEVEVSAEEVNGRVAQIAAQQGRRPENLRQEMAREGQLDQLFVQLREEKAIDRILERASIREVSAEQWRKMRGTEAAEPAPKARKGGKAAKGKAPPKPPKKPSEAEPGGEKDEKASAKTKTGKTKTAAPTQRTPRKSPGRKTGKKTRD